MLPTIVKSAAWLDDTIRVGKVSWTVPWADVAVPV